MPKHAFWSAHTHSRYSAKDALSSPRQLVAAAETLGYPALALTDHGNLAGVYDLYTSARKRGIEPVPGMETYLSLDRGNRRATVHMGLLAVNQQGWENLVGLNNHMHSKGVFYYKPVLDWDVLASLHEQGMLEGLAVTTGCWFGLLPTTLQNAPEAAPNVLMALAGWFQGRVFVEVMNHDIVDMEHDDYQHADLLWRVARETGLPCIATTDAHYCIAAEQPVHDTLKRLSSWSDDPSEAPFPGSGYFLHGRDRLARMLEPGVLHACDQGLDHLTDMLAVQIPELDEFHMLVPHIPHVLNVDDELRQRTADALDERLTTGLKPYKKALLEELEVICDAGFASYLLFVAVVCDWMRDRGITWSVRGSASGSLVCWLLGITSLDPLAWHLRFDRFLSRDRTKPPDIDIDVPHNRRAEVLAWLDAEYAVCHVGTWPEMGIQTDDSGDPKGSLLVKWKMNQRKLNPDNPRLDPTRAEYRELETLASYHPVQPPGVHAAGLVITPDHEALARVPQMWVASSGTTITAWDKKAVEAAGLLKLDILGLRTLSALVEVSELTGIPWTSVSLNADKKVYQRIATGRTESIFQLEGRAAANGCRMMQPRRVTDLVAAMSLFRPALLKTGDHNLYLQRRARRAPVPHYHPVIDGAVADTYGIALYQEQVLAVLRGIGLSPEEMQEMLSAVKASNKGVAEAAETMTRSWQHIQDMCNRSGFDADAIAWLKQALYGYADYSFNRAHSTSYGILAYVTAWFLVHHPGEWWTAVLNAYADHDKLKGYVYAARQDKVSVQPAHVNQSEVGYVWTGREILKGLLAVRGVGDRVAGLLMQQRPYADLDDLAAKLAGTRLGGVKNLADGFAPTECGGVIAALAEAGALRGLTRRDDD